MMEFLKPFWVQIIKWCAPIAALLALYIKARQDGKMAEQRKYAMDALKEGKISAKIDNDIAGASDTERKRLYAKWQRD